MIREEIIKMYRDDNTKAIYAFKDGMPFAECGDPDGEYWGINEIICIPKDETKLTIVGINYFRKDITYKYSDYGKTWVFADRKLIF